ncbi:hypothetical protein EXIGLDRAFT_767365 [Exidia glandulosa HHB12029]|uniref:Uncharacterized protein n=1 Tax=Exidia glandulosa HHB12029 TaxID=1314781 RepID=A0A165J1P5_EXIGL|nr:hypothetical protein EXIGLDRAFT_767365 [Exidia glandulosa HHB12029]
MDPHEAPTFQDWPVAPVDDEFKYGQVVLLTLDPLASVTPFEDEGGVSFLMNSDEEYPLNFHFLLVGEGLAEESQRRLLSPQL